MKPKITQKLAKEIVSKNPDAVRLIDYAKKQGWDVYYGSDNKKNPWRSEYTTDECSTCDIGVVSVGNGKRIDDHYFTLFVYENDDKSGLPDGDLSEQLQIVSELGGCWYNDEFHGWVVDDIIASNSEFAVVDGKKYEIWDCQDTDEIQIGRVKDGIDENEAEEWDWDELTVSFEEVEEFV